jgi:thiol:disulfide interchange protein DsbD
MEKIATAVILLLISLSVTAQIDTPVHWSYGAKMTSATGATVFLKATIADGWHIYSQKTPPGGPVKTSFAFRPSEEYTLTGKTMEPQAVIRFEPTFGVNVSFFEHSVIFQQKVSLAKPGAIVKGTLRYMVCNDEKCLPPADLDFSIPVQ